MKMRNDMPDGNLWSTRDLWLAAAMIAAGGRLLRLSWSGGRAFFIFADAHLCDETTQAYWSGDLRVAARSLTDALRLLKGRLHERAPNVNGDVNEQSNRHPASQHD